MPRLSRGDRLVIATHNAGKLTEMAALLAPYGILAESAAALGLPEPEETGASFEENALLKAEAAVRSCHRPAFADDSGLVVPALQGSPGIYSARWAGPQRDFALAMQRVEKSLAETLDRRAYFVAVLALVWPGGGSAVFRGEAHGTLVFPPRGERGFGYDPIFLADGQEQTFGEMAASAKHAMSHRAVAFAKLAAACLPQAETLRAER